MTRDALSDQAAQQIQLRPDEIQALKTIQSNLPIFFGGNALTQATLGQMINDPSQTPEVFQAALALRDNQTLVSLLNNVQASGAAPAGLQSADESISQSGFLRFMQKNSSAAVSSTNGQASRSTDSQDTEIAFWSAITSQTQIDTLSDMIAGQQEQPKARTRVAAS